MEIILIEDDDDDALRMMQFLKANLCNSVTRITDGNVAAEYLLFEYDSIPKLILLDIVLPFIDGIELYKMIKAEPARRNLKVLFLVTCPEEKQYLESLGLQPDGFLRKPTRQQIPVRI